VRESASLVPAVRLKKLTAYKLIPQLMLLSKAEYLIVERYGGTIQELVSVQDKVIVIHDMNT
jgi:hypothetical protein